MFRRVHGAQVGVARTTGWPGRNTALARGRLRRAGARVKFAAPLIALGVMLGIIWFLGTGRFGRAQTQAWIDRVRAHPRLFRWLDKHHGKFRAAGHYFEFGGLFLILYWLYDAIAHHGHFRFAVMPTVIIALICMVAAYLDEMHQLKSGTRQFRRVDFLHSCCGISLAAMFVEYQALLRGM